MTTDTIQHTPGPWEVQTEAYGDELWFGGEDEGLAKITASGEAVAYIGLWRKDEPEEAARREADAAFIVQACNAHADLLAALEAGLNFIEHSIPGDTQLDAGAAMDLIDFRDAAREAIRKARGA